DLVPRYKEQGYDAESVRQRLAWLEERVGTKLPLIAACAIPTETMRGNIESPIGAAQVPLGIAGPLLVNGPQARGTFYVPLATTEGALVRSYERGMVMLTRAGGVDTYIASDQNVVSPIFRFDSAAEAGQFLAEIPNRLDDLRREAEATTKHGRLKRIE